MFGPFLCPFDYIEERHDSGYTKRASISSHCSVLSKRAKRFCLNHPTLLASLRRAIKKSQPIAERGGEMAHCIGVS